MVVRVSLWIPQEERPTCAELVEQVHAIPTGDPRDRLGAWHLVEVLSRYGITMAGKPAAAVLDLITELPWQALYHLTWAWRRHHRDPVLEQPPATPGDVREHDARHAALESRVRVVLAVYTVMGCRDEGHEDVTDAYGVYDGDATHEAQADYFHVHAEVEMLRQSIRRLIWALDTGVQ